MDFIKTLTSGTFVALFAVQAFAQAPFSLSGKIEGMPDSLRITLVDVEDPNGKTVELAQTNTGNGRFELSGEVKSPRMCKLFFQRYSPEQDRYGNMMSVRMMIDPSRLSVTAPVTFDSLMNTRVVESVMKVSGSKVADEYAEYVAAVNSAERKMDYASYMNAAKYFESNDDRDTVRKYTALKAAAEREFLEAKLAFVESHPDYNISAYEVQNELTNIFRYDAGEIDRMADMVRECPDTARVGMVEKMRKFAHRYALGMDCPEFQATTPEGEVVDFKSNLTPGKYTFIDFWASWCGPCRAAIPHVKELHRKYGDRLDVYSVSVDTNEKGWRKAMEKEQMAWRQFHLNGEDQMGKGAKAFFITTIPRLVLLDDAGRVICSTNDPDEVSDMLVSRLGD